MRDRLARRVQDLGRLPSQRKHEDKKVEAETMRDEQQSVGSEIANILRADLLPNLVTILESFPALRSILPQVLQLAVVIDANIVYGELRWRLKKRPRSELRSSLEE